MIATVCSAASFVRCIKNSPVFSVKDEADATFLRACTYLHEVLAKLPQIGNICGGKWAWYGRRGEDIEVGRERAPGKCNRWSGDVGSSIDQVLRQPSERLRVCNHCAL